MLDLWDWNRTSFYLINSVKYGGIGGLCNFFRTFAVLRMEPNKVNSHPIAVQIEPTNACNIKCPMCLAARLDGPRRMLDLEDFTRIINQFPYVRKLTLQGLGEPFLNPSLLEMVKIAESRGIWVHTFTNGTLLTEDVIYRIYESGLDRLNISLDSFQESTYGQLRPGGDFGRVISALTILGRNASVQKQPDLHLYFVATKKNIEELPAAIRHARTLGVKKLHVQALHDFGDRLLHAKLVSDELLPNVELLERVERECVRVAEEVGVILFWAARFYHNNAERHCQWPWYKSYVTYDGYLTPCCRRGTDPSILNFGNILKRKFRDLWNCSELRLFRRELGRADAPTFCRGCPGYYQEF